MASLDQYFSVLALFILFRETIEASIICGVLLQFLNRAKPALKRAVWWGVVGGVVVSIIFGVIFISVYYTAQSNLFKGKNRDWFKGIISWVAALLITILGFAMLRFLGWEEKWKRRLIAKMATKLPGTAGKDDAAVDGAAATVPDGKDSLTAMRDTSPEAAATSKSGPSSSPPAPHKFEQQQGTLATISSSSGSAQPDAKAAAASDDKLGLTAADSSDVEAPAVEVDDSGTDLTPPTRKEFWNIWILVFTTVVREGIESVVFLGGLNGTKLSAIPLPAVVGITAGCLVGIFLYYSGKQVKHIKWLVIGMAITIFFIAAGQVNLGTDALMRAGMFGECSPWYDERPWIMVPLYDWSVCCSDIDPIGTESTDEQNRRRFFALARAIFGYQDKGTPLEIIIYTCYWSLVLLIAAFKSWRGTLFDADYKHTREQRRLAKEAAKRAALDAQLVAPLEGGALAGGQGEGAGVGEREGVQAAAGAPNVVVSVEGGGRRAAAPEPAPPKLGGSS
ncbi:Plasma membrane iron permease [Tetrabaena socialis]|uniref:Plasma membrane iron permease n=1 Tax=Tetrabaena socialis TaxID=47790 RepID=A0A2J8AIF9_9CHLO|nr:Plasma membrane iron permease [Tetrabaena socialis]|eukprot:PNH12297.1 Plasma membrane iron permease [Tetrabaena socialis]